MTKMRDKLLEEASTWEDYFCAKDINRAGIEKAKKSGVSGKSHSLPAPFNKADGKLEKDIQKSIINELKKLNIFYKRVSMGAKIISTKNGKIAAANELSGHPDIMIIANGLYIPIEVKRNGGKLSCAQWAIMIDMKRHGAFPLVGVSSDIVALVSIALEDPEKFKLKYKEISERLNFKFPVL